jgi:hypothetical protein
LTRSLERKSSLRTTNDRNANKLPQPNEVSKPTISDTVLVRLPVFIYNRTLGALINRPTTGHLVKELQNGSTSAQNDIVVQAAVPESEARRRSEKAGKN